MERSLITSHEDDRLVTDCKNPNRSHRMGGKIQAGQIIEISIARCEPCVKRPTFRNGAKVLSIVLSKLPRGTDANGRNCRRRPISDRLRHQSNSCLIRVNCLTVRPTFLTRWQVNPTSIASNLDNCEKWIWVYRPLLGKTGDGASFGNESIMGSRYERTTRKPQIALLMRSFMKITAGTRIRFCV